MEFLKQNFNCMEIPTESWQPSSLQSARASIGRLRPRPYVLIIVNWALTIRSVERRNRAHSSIAQIEKLSHLAELLVARVQQFPDGLIRESR